MKHAWRKVTISAKYIFFIGTSDLDKTVVFFLNHFPLKYVSKLYIRKALLLG